MVFTPYEDRFVALFPLITDEGAKRHFGKMMADWLTSHKLDKVTTEKIAEAAASWIIEPKVRVAVQIWAMEVFTFTKESGGVDSGYNSQPDGDPYSSCDSGDQCPT
ncbi:MAG: hypothetical protein ACK5JU_09465 [Bacteroidales bacterium]